MGSTPLEGNLTMAIKIISAPCNLAILHLEVYLQMYIQITQLCTCEDNHCCIICYGKDWKQAKYPWIRN